MLKRGISVVVGGKRKEASKEKKQGTDYISEEYAVRNGKMRDIIFRLGCGEPSVDGFATVENHLFPVWLGPGGYVENSLAAQWGEVELLWLNPPYSKLEETIQKVIKEKVRAVMVLPDWRSESWWKKIQEYVVKKYFYPKGTKMFELGGREVEGVRWGVWAYLVDCKGGQEKRKRQQQQEEKMMPFDREIGKEEWDEEKVRTSSARRRWRRKRPAGAQTVQQGLEPAES